MPFPLKLDTSIYFSTKTKSADQAARILDLNLQKCSEKNPSSLRT